MSGPPGSFTPGPGDSTPFGGRPSGQASSFPKVSGGFNSGVGTPSNRGPPHQLQGQGQYQQQGPPAQSQHQGPPAQAAQTRQNPYAGMSMEFAQSSRPAPLTEKAITNTRMELPEEAYRLNAEGEVCFCYVCVFSKQYGVVF